MNNKSNTDTINISKKTICRKGGVVILPIEEYEELKERAIPHYYLEEKEAEELDKLVEEGLEDYKEGKCKTIKSLKDLD